MMLRTFFSLSLLAAAVPSGAVLAQPVDESAAIQAQIDRAARGGGGVVRLEPRTYHVNRPIYLRDNVILAGAGPATLLTNRGLNDRPLWGGTIVFAGNLFPKAFSLPGQGLPSRRAARTGTRRLDLGQCRGKVPAPGSVVWITTPTVETGNEGMLLSRHAEMNLVAAVSGCSVTLADPISAAPDVALTLHWEDGNAAPAMDEPQVPIRNAGLADLALESSKSQGFMVNGCYRCTFTGLTIRHARSLFLVEGSRGSLFERIEGTFTERGIEFAQASSENVVRDVRGRFAAGSEYRHRPAIRFGEYAFGNSIENVELDLRDGYREMIKLRFDGSEGNMLRGVRFLLPQAQDPSTIRMYLKPGTRRESGTLLPEGTVLTDVTACWQNSCIPL